MKKANLVCFFIICVLTIFNFSHVLAKDAPPKIAAQFNLKLVKVCIEGKQVTINGVHNFGKKSKPEWNWGDGTVDVGMFPGKHLYKKPGTYTISLQMSEETSNGMVVKTTETVVFIQ